MPNPTLLLNDEDGHITALRSRLKIAERFTCMVAFAKRSGFALIERELKTRLKDGIVVVFVVGIDFYQTDPGVIETLLSLKRHGDLTIYMGSFDRSATFHPKLYVFETDRHVEVIVGSANLTGGGLFNNHELSVAYEGSRSGVVRPIRAWIEQLASEEEIVLATRSLVSEYRRRHNIYSHQMALARKRAKFAVESRTGGRGTLAEILQEMRADTSEWGFEAVRKRRAANRRRGYELLSAMASKRRMTESVFLKAYGQLLETMHSGGLHRGKSRVARTPSTFLEAIESLRGMEGGDPATMFRGLSMGLEHVDRAGTNLITEILHLIDNDRCAVMNQNSVAGLLLAGIGNFPEEPNRQNVTAQSYARFCSEATVLRRELGLENLSELDAVFNYAYWR
jgi:HKD family nuclease